MTKSIKVKFRSFLDEILLTETLDKKEITVICNNFQQKELLSLQPYLSTANTFHLIHCDWIEPNKIIAEFIILEPDYLIDISSLAECFKPFGNHPLNYILSRLKPQENTRHILLGNTANFLIDELVNEESTHTVEYSDLLKKLFKLSPFEFTACKDLKQAAGETAFFNDCKTQFRHIKHIVKEIFPKANIQADKIVLEPSFICCGLGLQGRLDIMLEDYSAFVELKSGKATEDFRTKQFIHSAENHYTQMILYLAVLEFNLDLNDQNINSYLLYSKYPILSKENHSKEQLQKALCLRNAIVAFDHAIQKNNSIDYTQQFFNQINPETLNEAKLSGSFFENYLRPQIERPQKLLKQLSKIEEAYFLRIYTFIVKELWLSKCGAREYEGAKRKCNLWSAPFAEKIAAGEILYNLQLKENQAGTDNHFIILSIPDYDNYYLPNFRTGDVVVVYEKQSEEDNLDNKQVFKGAIESLTNSEIKIRTRHKQKNSHLFKKETLYAVEHDNIDTVFSGMFNALSHFANADQKRKELLLGIRNPDFENSEDIIYPENDIDRIAQKALNAKDYFLLIGPPGTGKTSLALKRIVETCLEKNTGNILILAYTNRAVDEICKALYDIDNHLNFIRIGNELNCAPEYRKNLLENRLINCNRRDDVKNIISDCPVFVGTAASIAAKQGLFMLKSFNIAIVDEATQLLDPHLMGILSIKNESGNHAINRFVLIGDHKQLPAVVLQTKEESAVHETILNDSEISNLSNSLFERLYHILKKDNQHLGYDILTKQGRMHPVISDFPSRYFYESNLNCVGLPHQLEEWDAGKHRLRFIPSEINPNDTSEKINLSEAELIKELLLQLQNEAEKEGKTFQPENIGIITPFRNQIALIRKTLSETGIFSFSEIMVDTVERFQGSQKDIIIFSFCVKTIAQLNALPNLLDNSERTIDRKLNVVLTRAKKQLFIIGNESLLSKNQLFNELIIHVKKDNYFINPSIK